jgi:hypothetical protein
MKTKIVALFGLIALVMMALVTPAEAKKPLSGGMDLGFNVAFAGPGLVQPIWVGTVTLDDVEYGMAFFNIGTGKPFDESPSPAVSFFGEVWEIYDFETGNMDPSGFERGDIVMTGPDAGVVSFNNNKYRMNGSVENAHEGTLRDFSGWEGRNVHMSGTVLFDELGSPQFAPGTFRVN